MSDISTIYARFAVEAIERRAIDLESIFTGTSLNLERLRTQDSISINDFVTLLTNSRRLSNDDSIGLEIARRVQLPVLGQVSPAMTAAPTIRSGLQLLERYVRLLATYIEIELESLPEVLQVRIHFLKDLGPEVERFHAESSIANVQRYVELILGDHLRNACCLFKFPEPDYSERYREIYHSPCRFGQPNHAIELPHDLADKMSPFFESTTWVDSQSKLAKQLRQMQNHGRQSYEQHVKAFLKSQVPPIPGLESTAAHYGLSGRTLNRRLQHESTSFRTIRREVVMSLAEYYLVETSESIENIGVVVGYEDASNFRRAFRAWRGVSPAAFRRGKKAYER